MTDVFLGPALLAHATSLELGIAAEAVGRVYSFPPARLDIPLELNREWGPVLIGVLSQVLARGDGDPIRAIDAAIMARQSAREAAWRAICRADAQTRAANTAALIAAISAPKSAQEKTPGDK
jgi:hypothetical protein